MSSEFIVNLWAFCDYSTNLVYALSGRIYYAEGTETEKLDLLRRLSATDYRTTKRYEVPDRFSVTYGDGTTHKKLVPIQAVHDPNAHLFESIFTNLESDLAQLQEFSASDHKEFKQKLPSNLLRVATVLYEDETGKIRPIITDEDASWLKKQINTGLLDLLGNDE